jgi:hypothetical protein
MPGFAEAGPRSTAWIRSAHDVDVIPGRGVRCWVSSSYVINHAPALPHSLPSTPALRNALPSESFGCALALTSYTVGIHMAQGKGQGNLGVMDKGKRRKFLFVQLRGGFLADS